MQLYALISLYATAALGQGNASQQDGQPDLAMPAQFQPGIAPANSQDGQPGLALPGQSQPGLQQPDPASAKPEPSPTSIPMAQTMPGSDGFEYAIYQTEPNLRAPTVTIQQITKDLSKIQPGYLMFDPMTNTDPPGLGPLMYDTYTGELVGDGSPWMGCGAFATQNSHVCDFKGEIGNHVCYTESYMGRSAQRHVFSQHYVSVEPEHGFNGTGRFGVVDGHEFDMNPGGRTFQQLIHWAREVDLSSYGGLEKGGVLDPCMQEVDVETGEEIFAWCGLEHGLDIGASVYRAPKTATKILAWDFAHANALDKNEEGDYIMSIRYYNQVRKIAGPHATQVHGIEPGTVMWRLGFNGDFEIKPEGEIFFHQHDCRFVSTRKNEQLISIFDNHNTITSTDIKSAGKIYKLNNVTVVTTLVKSFDNPEPEPCVAIGSNRKMPNGNQLVGWGRRPWFTEFDSAGNILLHATFKEEHNQTYNYRVLKRPWVGLPKTRPKVIACSLTCGASQLAVYMSWNGATGVHSWRISLSSSPSHLWVLVGIYLKTGFETRILLSRYLISLFVGAAPRQVKVEALDADGEIFNVGETQTFIPRPHLVQQLGYDAQGCHGPKHFLYEASQNYIFDCKPTQSMSWSTILSFFLGVEGLLYFYHNMHLPFGDGLGHARIASRAVYS